MYEATLYSKLPFGYPESYVILREANKYIQNQGPWIFDVKNTPLETKELLNENISTVELGVYFSVTISTVPFIAY